MESSLPPPDSSPPPPVQPSGPSQDERNLAMLCHLLALAGIPMPILGNILGPLIVWLVKKESMPLVDAAGKESLNFQITVSIAMLMCMITWWLILPIVLLVAIVIGAIVFTIIAAIKTSEGVIYRYPWTIRFIK